MVPLQKSRWISRLRNSRLVKVTEPSWRCVREEESVTGKEEKTPDHGDMRAWSNF